MAQTFAERVIRFNEKVAYPGRLPGGIHIMNPYREDANTQPVSSAFYRKYFSDHHKRHIILGINPGRFGSGITGVSFTDTKRLWSECGIAFPGRESHEPSSVFIYDMIRAYGGVADFYRHFYINSICPLGFTISDDKGAVKNYNYYDSAALTASVHDFIIDSIRQQIAFGIYTDVCFCLGVRNAVWLKKINESHHFFEKIVTLEHPRYIMQYKQKAKQ